MFFEIWALQGTDHFDYDALRFEWGDICLFRPACLDQSSALRARVHIKRNPPMGVINRCKTNTQNEWFLLVSFV